MDFINIEIPFDEAENYFMPTNKEKLNKLFYQDRNFKILQLDTTYYLIGEKGSGKTTYCAYFCNNTINNIKSKRYPITVDDYNKIIQMKKEEKLNYTHYLTLWKAILLTKLLASIEDNEIGLFNGKAINNIRLLLQEYSFSQITMDTFSPVTFMDNEKFSAGIGGQISTDESKFNGTFAQENASQLTREKYIYEDNWIKFINTIAAELSKLRLKNHHYLFVDGIDIRPRDISYSEYSNCIFPLVRAVYELNSDILCKIKDRKKGRLQIVLLTRLDIFLKSGLSNAGSKIADNSAFLNWSMSNEKSYRTSELFGLVNNILGPNILPEDEKPWDKYFNFKIARGRDSFNSFNYFLRLTTSRPRDFVKLLKISKELCEKDGLENPTHTIIESDLFQRAYSAYYVDSLRTGLGFYYSEVEIRVLIDFIRSIRKCRITYGEFKGAWNRFSDREKLETTFSNCFSVISLLFDYNIIGLYEDDAYYRWKYREVSIANYDYGLEENSLTDTSKFRFHWAVEKEFGLYL